MRQDQAAGEVNPGLANASPEALVLWAQLLHASGGLGSLERDPIKAFKLQASVLTRNGVESNESEFSYSYLAPDCIKFSLPSDNVMGRFGKKPKEYWLRTPEGEVTVLSSSDYLQDRRTIARMHAVARNFVALSDLAGLKDISSLSLVPAPPAELVGPLHGLAKELAWLRITSPSFGLQATQGDGARIYTADIGLAREGRFSDLPLLALIRDTSSGERAPISAPMMLQLDNYMDQDGFKIPRSFFVYYLDPLSPSERFDHKPAQEIYLKSAELRPLVSLEHFKP